MDRGPAGGPPERHLASSVSIILASEEGWCQTLFLVLTCRLRNQKQSLIPGSTAVVLTVAGAGLRIGILAYQQHAAIGEVERFGGRVNMPGPPHQFFLCFWGVLCSYNHSI